MSKSESEIRTAVGSSESAGPWDPSYAKLREWDPAWAQQCFEMTTNPWTNGILDCKTVELISLAIHAACTNLNAEATRRHVRGALDAGAQRDEILMVLKMASLLSIHSCSLAAPILLEEAKAAGLSIVPKEKAATPVVDKTRAIGQWNSAWDPFFNLDPVWTEQFIAAGIPIYTSGLLPPKLAELLSIALDASVTHMYAPGTRRHIKAALHLGATVEEIMEVLKLCVASGVQAMNIGVAILSDELDNQGETKPS
jgi:alkylhydroperoxidase/carboxymuconolactone decarboxylase family protein YurZ